MTNINHENNPSEGNSLEYVLLRDNVDLQKLRQFSRLKGGFKDNAVRVQAWSKLLNINKYKNTMDFCDYCRESYRGSSQIRCDVERSLWSTDTTIHWEDERRDNRRKVLSDIITACLCRHSHLHYYQVSISLCDCSMIRSKWMRFARNRDITMSFLH
jgi:hypothetical protein